MKMKIESQKVGNMDEFSEKDASFISLIFIATDCIIKQGQNKFKYTTEST